MVTTTSDVSNTSFLQPTGFKLVINRERFPNLEFFAQSVNHPAISTGPTQVPFRRSDVFFPGDKITYSTLDVDVILDEEMKIYEELHTWMLGMVNQNFSNSLDQRLTDKDKSFYDIALNILTSHNNLNRTVRYKDAFPTSLGNINFTSSQGGLQYVIVPVTFQFTTFNFV